MDEDLIFSENNQSALKIMMQEFLKLNPCEYEGDDISKILESSSYSGVKTNLEKIMNEMR
jgi:hypothetical protein